MPTFDEMVEEEIFATAPVDPRTILSPAEYSNGFNLGDADINFFNGVVGRMSDLLWRNQENTKIKQLEQTVGEGGTDAKLLFRNFFSGTLGTDALNVTSVTGSGLENEAGSGLNKYFCTGNSTLVSATDEKYPLYADCGQSAVNIRGTSIITVNLNPLSTDGDFFAMSFNCIGRYERTDIGVEIANSLTQLRPFLRRYDTAGLLVNEVLKDPIDINQFLNRASMFRVKDRSDDGEMFILFPVYGIRITLAEDLDQGTLSDKHGFTFSPQSFQLASQTYNLMDIIDEDIIVGIK